MKHTIMKIGKDLPFNASEAYRTIQSNLSFLIPDRNTGIIIGLTSAVPKDGKTFTSINMAFFLAESGKKVLLIDGDMRCASVARNLRIEAENGLSEYLSSQTEEINIRKDVIYENADVLTSGKIPPNAFVLLCSDRCKKMLESLRSSYDYILIDLPPINVVAESASLSWMADGVVLVVREGHTKYTELSETIRQLKLTKSTIVGVIYNCRKSTHGGYYHKSYYYKSESK